MSEKKAVDKMTWVDWVWPDWVPKDVRENIQEFWSCFGRDCHDWLKDTESREQPAEFGEVVWAYEYGGTIGHGRYIHAWNNIGRVITFEGKTFFPAHFDVYKDTKMIKARLYARVDAIQNERSRMHVEVHRLEEEIEKVNVAERESREGDV